MFKSRLGPFGAGEGEQWTAQTWKCRGRPGHRENAEARRVPDGGPEFPQKGDVSGGEDRRTLRRNAEEKSMRGEKMEKL